MAPQTKADYLNQIIGLIPKTPIQQELFISEKKGTQIKLQVMRIPLENFSEEQVFEFREALLEKLNVFYSGNGHNGKSVGLFYEIYF